MFYDTDAGGVVHNIAYLRFVEKARTLLGAKLGLSLKQMSKSGLYAVVTRTEIDYLKPALLGDELTVQGWLRSYSYPPLPPPHIHPLTYHPHIPSLTYPSLSHTTLLTYTSLSHPSLLTSPGSFSIP